MHIWYILYISILDMLIDWCAAFGDSDDDDDERSDPETHALPSPEHSPPPPDPQPPSIPSHASLGMRKVMLAAGGPSYEKVLHDADIQIGPDAENIPSERCGGEARRANLKRKARYITRSVAETFAYCTSNTVSTQNAADILQTFTNVRTSCPFLF